MRPVFAPPLSKDFVSRPRTGTFQIEGALIGGKPSNLALTGKIAMVTNTTSDTINKLAWDVDEQ